jgi:hypothetical protein
MIVKLLILTENNLNKEHLNQIQYYQNWNNILLIQIDLIIFNMKKESIKIGFLAIYKKKNKK